MEIATKEAVKKLNEMNISLNGDEEYVKETVTLDCGARLEIELTDEKEFSFSEQIISKIIEPAQAGSSSTELYKDYGKRKYTATLHIIASVGTWISFYVINHYTISNSGLSVRSVASDYKNGTYVSRLASSSKKEDNYATAKGTDINCIGRMKYEAYVPLIGASAGTYNVKLRNYVKLLKLDKKNKRAKIQQHCKSWSTKYYDW